MTTRVASALYVTFQASGPRRTVRAEGRLPRLEGRRVLLVEDELLIALDLQLSIEDEGADVALADGVRTGLAAIAEHQASDRLPDVALLDVRLGDGEVFPIADLLAKMGVPIVFHSGHAQSEDLAAAYPGAAVLSKPAPIDRLVTALAERL